MSKHIKRVVVLLLLLGLIAFSSCSLKPNKGGDNTDTLPSEDEWENFDTPTAPPQTNEPTPSPTPTPSVETPESQVIQVSAEDSVGPPIKLSDLDQLGFNPRLMEMIDESSPHGIEDYINGVVPTNNAYILNERFTDEIIGGLSLGDSFEKVRMVLGNPGWETDDILLFRTQNYYLLFQGNQRADYAVVMKAPVNEYPPDILKIILEALNGEEYLSLEESLLKIDLKDGFFEEWGFIHGGGYYYSTKNGINLIDFDEKYIEVYNNYEGDLYQYALPDPRFEVRFIDRDMVIDYMLNEFNRYLEVEELFQNDGVVSPDGKLCAVYEWLYSMNHHFIVRTLDHSIQDRYIYVSSESTFQWLTNNHLVYIDPYNQIPYAIDVNFSDPGAINILYEAGIINERDVDPGKYEYELIEANTQSVILKDRLNDQTVTVQFSEDKKGSISFTAQ